MYLSIKKVEIGIYSTWVQPLGRSPGEGKGCPLQYSGLENSMDCVVHGVAKSWTRLSDFSLSPVVVSAYVLIYGRNFPSKVKTSINN